MHLIHLLERLSPDERRALLERRGLVSAKGLDNQALSNQLTTPQSLAQVLLDLDAFQLKVLRWLSQQHGLEAPWSAFVGELRGRVPSEQVQAELLDLRRAALLDFDPSPERGFIATFPAVVAAAPARGWSLRQYLPQVNSDDLRAICSALGLQRIPSTRDARVELARTTLSQPEACRHVLDSLPPDARTLLEAVRVRGGRVSRSEMEQLPGGKGASLMSSGWYYRYFGTSAHDPLSRLLRVCLLLPVGDTHGGWWVAAFAVPDEVETALAGQSVFDVGPLMVPPLRPAQVASGATPDPTALLRDVFHLLGFIAAGRCEWRQDGGPYQRSLAALGKLLGNPDKNYPTLLWVLCLTGGLVTPAPRGQSGYVPAKLAQLKPADTFDLLLEGWTQLHAAPVAEWQSYQLTGPARIRFLQLIQEVPPDTWITRESLRGLLAFYRPLLFAESPEPGRGDPIWSTARHLILAEGATPDGQAAVMVPATIQTLLSDDPRSHAVLPPWDEQWVVQADRAVVAPPNAHPQALIELWKMAALESNQGAAIFRLTPASVAAGLNRGLEPSQILKLLKQRSRTPIPATVERLVQDQGKRYGRIKIGAAQTYVRTDDPTLLEEVLRHRQLSELRWHTLAPGVAVLEGMDSTETLQRLRKAGYLPVMDGRERQPDRASKQAPGAAADLAVSRLLPVKQVARQCREAITLGASLSISWFEGARVRQAVFDPIDLHSRELHATRLEDGREMLLDLDSVMAVNLVTDGEEEGP